MVFVFVFCFFGFLFIFPLLSIADVAISNLAKVTKVKREAKSEA